MSATNHSENDFFRSVFGISEYLIRLDPDLPSNYICSVKEKQFIASGENCPETECPLYLPWLMSTLSKNGLVLPLSKYSAYRPTIEQSIAHHASNVEFESQFRDHKGLLSYVSPSPHLDRIVNLSSKKGGIFVDVADADPLARIKDLDEELEKCLQESDRKLEFNLSC